MEHFGPSAKKQSPKPFWESRLILKVQAGSHAYGTNIENSDVDTRGICIPPVQYLLGLERFEQKESKDPDEVIYSLSKFVSLALDANPNILDILFANERHVLFENHYGGELRDLRHKFLSKRVAKTYGGYAYSQLKRMTRLGDNPSGVRAESIAKFGYDTKNAMHLIRLLKMGIEILAIGEVYVLRPDRDYLLSIRRGEFTLEEIQTEAERLMRKLDEACKKSALPDKPAYNEINEWLVWTQRSSLNWSPEGRD